MALIEFLASSAGRTARIIAGIVLIVVGLLVIEGTIGTIVAVIGVVPLLAGLSDFCLFGPLFGAALSGAKIRSRR